jgi:hypothetical protein
MDTFSIRDFALIISTPVSVSPSLIVQICLLNMQMRAITYAIAQEKQFESGAISDESMDPSAFMRIV